MQVNVKYRSCCCQDSQKLQNNASSHYPTTIFALCIYFLQYETPHFRIHVFRTRRLIHTPSLSWLQNLNFKFGALRREKRRGLAFYTRTSCLTILVQIKHNCNCCRCCYCKGILRYQDEKVTRMRQTTGLITARRNVPS